MSDRPHSDPFETEKRPYEAPAIVFEEVMEALASSCADCDLNGTKSSGGTCSITGSPCISPFNS